MHVSSTNEGEPSKEIIAAPRKMQRSEFSCILNSQIADSVKPAHAADSTKPLQTINNLSITQDHLLSGADSKHDPAFTTFFAEHPVSGKGSREISFPTLHYNKPSIKEPQVFGNPATHENTPAPNKKLNAACENQQDHQPLLLGTISKNNPTVSDLMIKHPVYGKDCWKILHSSSNRDKPYTAIPNGSRIYLDPKTLEVDWKPQAVSDNDAQIVNDTLKDVAPVFLGTISKSDPTVSDLMIKHPVYGKDCWKILHSSSNRDKPYTAIPNGSRIYLDPKTLEVNWNRDNGTAAQTVLANHSDLPAKHLPAQNSDPFSTGLAKAVKPYLGKPYTQMNCFELVVQGLEGLGIPYYGRGGLGERLVKMAMEKDLSINHYLSGEGLVETSGSQVYAKSVPRISNSKAEAHDVYQEIAPFLQEGLILSFSTPTRGHTGIVSRRKQDWTYINSGQMDNPVEGATSKGVGEEFLKAEIGNWFRLAAGRSEPLQITVGRLDEDKLRALLPGQQLSHAGIPEFPPEHQKPHPS